MANCFVVDNDVLRWDTQGRKFMVVSEIGPLGYRARVKLSPASLLTPIQEEDTERRLLETRIPFLRFCMTPHQIRALLAMVGLVNII